MPSNSRLTIANMGLKAYLDGTIHIHNGTDYAWFEDAMRRYEAKEMTKKEIYDAMSISPVTLDKYILIYNIERVQQNGKQ
jgi:hypothetical protein